VKQSKEHLKLEGRFGIQTFVCSSSEKKKKEQLKKGDLTPEAVVNFILSQKMEQLGMKSGTTVNCKDFVHLHNLIGCLL
jgi:hypothetical protein